MTGGGGVQRAVATAALPVPGTQSNVRSEGEPGSPHMALGAGSHQAGGAVGAGVDGVDYEGDDLGGAGDGDGPGVGAQHAFDFADLVHLSYEDGCST